MNDTYLEPFGYYLVCGYIENDCAHLSGDNSLRITIPALDSKYTVRPLDARYVVRIARKEER